MSNYPMIKSRFLIPDVVDLAIDRALLKSVGVPLPSKRLTLVTAPPGYGKTTILAQWSSQTDAKTVWLSLDQRDNTKHRLLTCLVEACEWAGVGAVNAGQKRGEDVSADSLMARLLNGFHDYGKPICLILDGSEVLKSRQAWEVIETVIRRRQPNLYVVVSGRRRPALNVPAFRAAGELGELGVSELSFTVDEIGRLIEKRGLSLSASEVYRLNALTEGWPVGVQLWTAGLERAARSLVEIEGHRLVEELVMYWTREYLLAEVLNQLPDEVQEFVLGTCHVHSVNEALASELMTEDLTRTSFKMLERNFGLLTRMGNGDYVCYHPMFRAAFYLEAHERGRVREQHKKAAVWLLAKKRYGEALYHYARSHNAPELLKLIEQHAFDLLREGEVSDIDDTLLNIPAMIARDHYVLAMIEASVVHVSKDVRRIRACIRRLNSLSEEAPGAGNPDRLMQTLAYLRSLAHYLDGNLRHSIRVCTDSIEASTGSGSLNAAASVARFHRAVGYHSLGYLDRAYEDALQAHNELDRLELSGYTNTIGLLLGQIELSRGEIPQAEQRFLGLAQEASCSAASTRNFYDVYCVTGLGLVRREQNRFEEAVALLREAANIAHRFKPSAALPWIFHHLGITAWAQGNKVQANEFFREGQSLARRQQLYVIYRLSGAYRARLLMTTDEMPTEYVHTWYEEWGRARSHYGKDIMPEEQLAVAWYHYQNGNNVQALQYCHELLESTRKNRQIDLLVDSLLLKASLARHEEDLDGAFQQINTALSISSERGLQSLFFREGRELNDLFQQGMSSKAQPSRQLGATAKEAELLEQLLRSQIEAGTQKHSIPDLLPFEPLTKREREVLQCMADGMANQIIADALFVSISTVKTHVNSIFRKLEVSNREAACARAAQYHLLAK